VGVKDGVLDGVKELVGVKDGVLDGVKELVGVKDGVLDGVKELVGVKDGVLDGVTDGVLDTVLVGVGLVCAQELPQLKTGVIVPCAPEIFIILFSLTQTVCTLSLPCTVKLKTVPSHPVN
jgi:hypothetical protein